MVKVFWGLEDKLAFRRHFPAINWLVSYSQYTRKMMEYWDEGVDDEFPALRNEAMGLLQRESELEEIVRLVGIEALSDQERMVMEGAKSIREDFLMQNAFDDADAYTSLRKQFRLLHLIMVFHYEALKALEEGKDIQGIIDAPVREDIARAKYIPEGDEDRFDELEGRIVEQLAAVETVS